MKRRQFVAGLTGSAASGLLARSSLAQGGRAATLRFVPQANLSSIDPIWTTAYISRNHGYMVYDTLYGMDRESRPQPQMAAGHVEEADGRIWTITLRDGLAFHDGEPVRAQDAVASIQRWWRRNAYGQKLAATTDELVAIDDKRLRFRLKKPFPLLLHALSFVGQPPFIMPERVEWRIISDGGTSAAALQAGEVDWFEQPELELQELLARHRDVVVEVLESRPGNGFLRLNHLHPPFNNKGVRQALLWAVSQADFMTSTAGPDRAYWQDGVGVFSPGTPMANAEGLEPLTAPRDVAKARRLLQDAGYRGEKLRLIGPSDIPVPTAWTQVAADLLQRVGFDLDLAISDWGTVLQRRASRASVEQGGWSAFLSGFPSYDFADPASHPLLRANGPEAWLGWPDVPAIEALREDWFDVPDDAARKRIAGEIQRLAIEEVMYVPIGASLNRTALRRNLSGRLDGLPLFWSLRRS